MRVHKIPGIFRHSTAPAIKPTVLGILSNHRQFDAGLVAWRSFSEVALSEYPGDLFFLSFSPLFCYNAIEAF
jgi:hypothetical protein